MVQGIVIWQGITSNDGNKVIASYSVSEFESWINFLLEAKPNFMNLGCCYPNPYFSDIDLVKLCWTR